MWRRHTSRCARGERAREPFFDHGGGCAPAACTPRLGSRLPRNAKLMVAFANGWRCLCNIAMTRVFSTAIGRRNAGSAANRARFCSSTHTHNQTHKPSRPRSLVPPCPSALSPVYLVQRSPAERCKQQCRPSLQNNNPGHSWTAGSMLHTSNKQLHPANPAQPGRLSNVTWHARHSTKSVHMPASAGQVRLLCCCASTVPKSNPHPSATLCLS